MVKMGNLKVTTSRYPGQSIWSRLNWLVWPKTMFHPLRLAEARDPDSVRTNTATLSALLSDKLLSSVLLIPSSHKYGHMIVRQSMLCRLNQKVICNLKIFIYILDQVEERPNPLMSPFLAISNSWNFFRRSPLSAVSEISSITRITQTEGWGWLEKTIQDSSVRFSLFIKEHRR